MKRVSKTILSIIILIIVLFGCSPMNMNNVIKEPNFTGIVKEVYDTTILVLVDKSQEISADLVSVSTKVKLKDSITDFKVGDHIKVYYNGVIAESYPAQILTVYAIILLDSE